MCEARHAARRWRDGPGHADGQRAALQASLRAQRMGVPLVVPVATETRKPARRFCRT